jgi:peroxiredoxin
MSVDPAHDIAVLRVDPLPGDVHVVEIQSRELPTLGNSVWTLGHPNGLKNTAGWGQVSAIRKTAEMPEGLQQALKSPSDSRWLQTTAVIAQGSSGGPLLNEDGKAIGINTFLLSPQLGFAVHISHARDAFVKAMEGKPLMLPFPPEQDEDALAWLSPEVAPLLQEYSEALAAFQQSAAGLSRAEAISKVNDIRDTYRGRFLTLARQDPESWPGLQALAYAAQTCSGGNDDDALHEVCNLALEHHGKNRQISSILRMVAQKPGDAVSSFARSLVEESPHEVVRLSGCMTLAMNQLQRLQYPDSLDLESMLQSRQDVEEACKQLEEIAAASKQETIQRDGKLLAEQVRQQLGAIQTGLSAPEISGVDSEGTEFQLSEYRGKVILLDFFADWCPHCKRMYPAERKMVEDMKDRPFALLGIHCESEQVLQRLINTQAVTWRCWADGDDGAIAASWSLEGFPTMVLLDETGRIRYRWNGVPDEKQLQDFVEELVSQAETDTTDGQDASP